MRTALLKEDNSAAIKVSERTPLSDWLNMLPRDGGTAKVTELPLSPKGMLWACCIVLALKSYGKICMQTARMHVCKGSCTTSHVKHAW